MKKNNNYYIKTKILFSRKYSDITHFINLTEIFRK